MKKRYKIRSIAENTCKGINIKHDKGETSVIVVRQGSDTYCYFNKCPHTGINLDWMPDQFLDSSGQLIQCATHGALFRIADGYCVSGPCAGQSLQAPKIKVDDEMLEIELN